MSTTRKQPGRQAQFKGKYQGFSSSGGGFHRNNSQFIDPPNPFTSIVEPYLKSQGGIHKDLIVARTAYSRKTMGPKVTEGMKKRDKKLARKERTKEAQRVIDHPIEGLQELGVERNHINANSQVATQITAISSAYLGANNPKKRKAVVDHYQSFAEAHELPVSSAKKLSKDFKSELDSIEVEPDASKRQRSMTSLLNKHTTDIADQPGNLRFGRSQHQPNPALKITIPKNPVIRSNQDVGSFWDGNRKSDGSESPRTDTIHKTLVQLETNKIFPPGLSSASTQRPKMKDTKQEFGSLMQQSK